ncbi:adenylate kinase-domain-containing protein [Kockovaella imperatae]|uniref:Uridylate kinase n=1 Tax=Kockovaella imperatae TaxID=4999 RepID=A0A1Y1UMB8_9TREE|nr:adenylate kinase-domain-containing protein [Kockovaella imperatae]ORX39190.1 adenylate kinase-domain-containing protein [Kockovaella imperatae]
MTIVDKLKEKLHLGGNSKSVASESPAVPPKSSASSNPAVPPKDASPVATKDSLPDLPETEVFDHEKVTVIFVLGGPGAGKGTQCENLVRDYGFKHLSAGDLLRAEQTREGSEYGDMIKQCIVEGQIVPMEVTVKLLENAMRDTLAKPPSVSSELSSAWEGGKGRFLIDGFPRKMDQAIKFDEAVCQSSFVLFIATTEEVMLERLLERGKTSGRSDDNEESIKKRFKTFEETSMPVVDYYRSKDKVVEASIDSSPPVQEVYQAVRAAIDPRLGVTAPQPVSGIPEPVAAVEPVHDEPAVLGKPL